jgi:Tautomerase enzyme
MPLVRIDAVRKRSETEIQSLLDAAHSALVSAFKVPERDRYQIYTEHPQNHVVALDTGLGIPRSPDLLIFSITSRARDEERKKFFYAELCRELEKGCGISSADVIVNITINSPSDWSFGLGTAQFLTGQLG